MASNAVGPISPQLDYSELHTPQIITTDYQALQAPAVGNIEQLSKLLVQYAQKFAIGQYNRFLETRVDSSRTDRPVAHWENGRVIIDTPYSEDTIDEWALRPPDQAGVPSQGPFSGDPLMSVYFDLQMFELRRRAQDETWGSLGNYYTSAHSREHLSLISVATVSENFPEIAKVAFSLAVANGTLPTIDGYEVTGGGLSKAGFDHIPLFVTGYQERIPTTDGSYQYSERKSFPNGQILMVGENGKLKLISQSEYETLKEADVVRGGLRLSSRKTPSDLAKNYLTNELHLPADTLPTKIQRTGENTYQLLKYYSAESGFVTLDPPVTLTTDNPSLQDTLTKANKLLLSSNMGQDIDVRNKVHYNNLKIQVQNYLEQELGYPQGSKAEGHFNWDKNTFTLQGVRKPGQEDAQFRDIMINGGKGMEIPLTATSQI